MSRIYYNKLIRDLVPQKITDNGDTLEVRQLTDETEFEKALLQKVLEEAAEVAAASGRTEFLAKYADLLVVLDALTHHYGFSEADIRVAMAENVAQKGLYKERHFLHWSAGSEDQKHETS